MNEHVGVLQTDFYKTLANEPKQQSVLSEICGESVKDSAWGAHYLLKECIFRGDAGKLLAASCEAGPRLGSAGRKPGRGDVHCLCGHRHRACSQQE